MTAVGLVVTIAVALPPRPAPSTAQGLQARIVPWTQASATTESFRVTDGNGASLGTAQWRVVTGTGNCCENYIATTVKGRILDLGGDFLKYSDDRGMTWHHVLPAVPPAINGWEGAVSGAPGGDVVGATWSPYAGDQLVAFKYEAASDRWLSAQTVIHTPFFDRPWIGVIPGPFKVGSQTAPYVSVLTSNFTRDVAYYSLDGLNYFLPNSKQQDEIASERKSRWLTLAAEAGADWIQPASMLDIAPLAGGGALGDCCSPGLWGIMEPPDIKWAGFSLPEGQLPDGSFLTDSEGRLHHVAIDRGTTTPTYRMSSDGGRTWAATPIPLPSGYRVDLRGWDFKADAALDTSVLGIHATHSGSGLDQDFVFELSTAEATPRLRRVHYVGAGDLAAGSGLGQEFRFDFSTIGLLPDGKIVTSFVDKAHHPPALAILLSAPEPQPSPSPSTSTPPVDTTPPTLTAVTDRPDPFEVGRKKARLRIDYDLGEDAHVTVSITRAGRVVRRLVDEERTAGSWSDEWDGRTRRGGLVRAGRYRYEIVARDAAGLVGRASGTIRVRRR